MKKLFITIMLIFTVLSTQAQKQFEGKWTSKNSTYTTTIIAREYAVLKVFNFSFEEDYFIEEKIISQNLSLIHISEPTRPERIAFARFSL